MKRLPLLIAAMACVLHGEGVWGQDNRQDTTRKPLKVGEELPMEKRGQVIGTDTLLVEKTDGSGKKKLVVRFETGDGVRITRERSRRDDDDFEYTESENYSYNNRKRSKAIAGITFARMDFGFATLLDNGSFTLSPENDFLRYRTWKTWNFGFDLLQLGYRFDEKFKIFLSAGFDWTYYRLRRNVVFDPRASELTYTERADEHFDMNRLTSAYIRLPLTLEHRFGPSRGFKVAYGPIGGLLMHGSQLYKGPEGKVKVREDFNFTKFRYGAFARVGYNSFGLYAKYYFNDVFENSPQQEGLKNLSMGVMFFF
ncbi:PorT family protein [Olivibacter sitiensis]|uniref:PorT family protein n=1 Tax=Olivibacter sitiensis TaxID=376470 RepID=UPI00042A86F3|nr:PorT family protein [Olivibacter sitiensis]